MPPKRPSLCWAPLWEWYQNVPASSARKMYQNVVPGSIGHWLIIPAPSIHGVLNCVKPCQWIVVTSVSSILVTSTTGIWSLYTTSVGPGSRPLIPMNVRKARPSAVLAWVQFVSLHPVLSGMRGMCSSCPVSLIWYTFPAVPVGVLCA